MVPFGKYKGATVEEILRLDASYVQWIISQPWLADRHANLHAALLQRGASTDDTPAHNAIQVRFLDYAFQQAALRLIAGKKIGDALSNHIDNMSKDIRDKIRYAQIEMQNATKYLASLSTYHWSKETSEQALVELPKEIAGLEFQLNQIQSSDTWTMKVQPLFEQLGVDVILRWHWTGPGLFPDWRDYGYAGSVNIEIKPTLGDDYPTTMRQMQRLGCHAVVVGEYIGRAVTKSQVRQMFAANGSGMILLEEIENELPRRIASAAPLPF